MVVFKSALEMELDMLACILFICEMVASGIKAYFTNFLTKLLE
jgi:hypothetical protein